MSQFLLENNFQWFGSIYFSNIPYLGNCRKFDIKNSESVASLLKLFINLETSILMTLLSLRKENFAGTWTSEVYLFPKNSFALLWYEFLISLKELRNQRPHCKNMLFRQRQFRDIYFGDVFVFEEGKFWWELGPRRLLHFQNFRTSLIRNFLTFLIRFVWYNPIKV